MEERQSVEEEPTGVRREVRDIGPSDPKVEEEVVDLSSVLSAFPLETSSLDPERDLQSGVTVRTLVCVQAFSRWSSSRRVSVRVYVLPVLRGLTPSAEDSRSAGVTSLGVCLGWIISFCRL